jgi:hypothetical protein
MVGTMLYFNEDVVVKTKVPATSVPQEFLRNNEGSTANYAWIESRGTKTTIPFVKNNEFDYAWVLGFLGEEKSRKWAWLIFHSFCNFSGNRCKQRSEHDGWFGWSGNRNLGYHRSNSSHFGFPLG